jgi:thiosulfate dehydrogenase
MHSNRTTQLVLLLSMACSFAQAQTPAAPRPVKANLEKDFPARWNKPIDAAFPPYVLGAPPDQHKYGPFPPLAEKARALAEKRAKELKEKEAVPAAK